MPTDLITVHLAALAPLGHDWLEMMDIVAPHADWLMANAPGCFVRLYVVDHWRPHVLVPAARRAAVGADVMLLEERDAD